jgi:hypothetical protein
VIARWLDDVSATINPHTCWRVFVARARAFFFSQAFAPRRERHPQLDHTQSYSKFLSVPAARGGTFKAIIALLLVAAAPEPPSTVQHVPPEQALAVLGHTVTDPDGKNIGRLVDVLVGDNGEPQAAVIDFGGFMGVGSRKIAVEWSALHFAPANTKQPITLDLSQDQIKAAPEYKDPAKPAPVVVAPTSPSQ